jgi:hypothetical protein
MRVFSLPGLQPACGLRERGMHFFGAKASFLLQC